MEYRFEDRPMPKYRRGHRGLSAALRELTVDGPCLYVPVPPTQSFEKHRRVIASTASRIKREHGGNYSVRGLDECTALGVWRIA